MSLHSFSPTSQLLHSNVFPAAQSPPPTSVFATNKGIILADFVGLYCKSRRARPRIGVSGHRRFHKFSAGKFGTINAVLDLDRIKNAAEQSSSRSDSKPKVKDIKMFKTQKAGSTGMFLSLKGFHGASLKVANVPNGPSALRKA
ncbi:hypothetical protein CK203_027191 [Vitis vinifera]|uniref:Uncharacterized protein n=1 Tax=Vitis vinifera TaxID=29760 RepID=A0A438I631_VITVI|nr:hypothetical protein CK203_027191 [Vitis vinifera]